MISPQYHIDLNQFIHILKNIFTCKALFWALEISQLSKKKKKRQMFSLRELSSWQEEINHKQLAISTIGKLYIILDGDECYRKKESKEK